MHLSSVKHCIIIQHGKGKNVKPDNCVFNISIPPKTYNETQRASFNFDHMNFFNSPPRKTVNYKASPQYHRITRNLTMASSPAPSSVPFSQPMYLPPAMGKSVVSGDVCETKASGSRAAAGSRGLF